jgi:hypothetical protein
MSPVFLMTTVEILRLLEILILVLLLLQYLLQKLAVVLLRLVVARQLPPLPVVLLRLPLAQTRLLRLHRNRLQELHHHPSVMWVARLDEGMLVEPQPA